MKMLKKSFLFAALLAFAFTTAQAQGKGGKDFDPVKHAEKQTAMMTEKLGLSADQAAKVKAINLKYAEKAKADNPTGDKAKSKEAHKAMRAEKQAEIKKVLTADQAAKWEQMMAERKGKGRGHGEGKAKGAGRGDFDPAKRAEMQTARMTEKLGLSADQSAKVKAINQKYGEKAKATHDANAGADKGKMKAAHQTLRAEHDAEIKKVLTKDQAAKWEQMKAEHKGERGKKQLKPNKEDLKKG